MDDGRQQARRPSQPAPRRALHSAGPHWSRPASREWRLMSHWAKPDRLRRAREIGIKGRSTMCLRVLGAYAAAASPVAGRPA